MRIGAQLFTVRDFCKDLDSFAETLKRVADIGYRYVQVSATCPFEGPWLDAELKKNGLTCVLTHTPPAELADPAATARKHDLFGCKNVGLGYYKFDPENLRETFDKFFETYLPIVDGFADSGKYFMYHNHAYEFQKIDGKVILAHIAERLPADKAGIVLDTYWVQVGGGDPAAWIERFKGRVPCIHLKDFAYNKVMAVIGEGNINFDRVFTAAEDAGTEYMLVEQDNCNGEDPFDCLKRSYDYLRSRGFE